MRIGQGRVYFVLYAAAVPVLMLGALGVFGEPSLAAQNPGRILIQVAFVALPLVAAWRAWLIGSSIKRGGFDLAPGPPSRFRLIAGTVGLVLVMLSLGALLAGLSAFAEMERQSAASATAQLIEVYRRGGILCLAVAVAFAGIGGVMAWPLVKSALRRDVPPS